MKKLSTADRLLVVALAATAEKAGSAIETAGSIHAGCLFCPAVYTFPLTTRSTVNHSTVFPSIADGNLTRYMAKIALNGFSFIDSERSVQYIDIRTSVDTCAQNPTLLPACDLGMSLPAVEEQIDSRRRV